MTLPLISICIPAYKQPELLSRTLDSICNQTYTSVEVIISDDSPDNSVLNVCNLFTERLNIRYYKNIKPLGSPKNWNNSIGLVKGEYYMLLHHDDWFEDVNAIKKYVSVFQENNCDGVFSKSNPLYSDLKLGDFVLNKNIIKNLHNVPDYLILSNQVGPPSNLMLKSKITDLYDETLLWLVDVEFYIRLLKKGYKFYFIEETLLNIGLHEEQITNFCQQRPDIIVKENIMLGRQAEGNMWKQIKFYDYFWRLIRNYKVRSVAILHQYGLPEAGIPKTIKHIINDQSKIPLSILNFGPSSKALMFLSYLKNRFNKK